MIQFNLLPDVKLEYIRTKRMQRTIMTISILVSAAAFAIFVILLVNVFILQKTHMSHLTSDIKTSSKDLTDTKGLDKILTVQNQLNSLPAIHAEKPAVTRVLPYIKQVTPSAANISSLELDFEQNIMTITGETDSLQTVNKFVDTLKFTEYKTDEAQKTAFHNVVLSNFERTEKGASYTIDLQFEPVIFDNNQKVNLIVPKIITTRSELEKPASLFEKPTTPQGEQP